VRRHYLDRRAPAGSSWGTILRPAAFEGRLCFGPSVGQRVRFTRPNTWLANTGCSVSPPVDPLAATAAVTRRYLEAYGPATVHDLARGGVEAAAFPRHENGSPRSVRKCRRSTWKARRPGFSPLTSANCASFRLAGRAPAARLRSVCGRRVVPCRAPAARQFSAPRVPATRPHLAGAAGQWPYGGHLAA